MFVKQAVPFQSSSNLACGLRKVGTRGRGGTNGDEQYKRCCTKWLSMHNSSRHSTISSGVEHREASPVRKRLSGKTYIYAESENACIPEPETNHSKDLWSSVCEEIDAFYRFTRPHTIIGTIVGITSVSFLAIESTADLSSIFFAGLLKALVPAVLMNIYVVGLNQLFDVEIDKALVPAVLMNIYVVGLNQLFDVEIDKVNKPTLPLASGEYSMEKGLVIIVVCCFLSFAMGIKFQTPPLLGSLLISFLLGSAYSINLPFLRWKQHAFLAASSILCVRAICVQLGFFLHMQRYVLGRPAMLTKSVIFATVFMCFFTAVIALFKDIPDVDGDRDFGIQSFSVRLGHKRVFWLCIKLLITAYGSAILVGASSSNMFEKLVTVLGHGLLASILWFRAQSLDIQNKASITSFYMFIWKLFYAEYFLIPFIH